VSAADYGWEGWTTGGGMMKLTLSSHIKMQRSSFKRLFPIVILAVFAAVAWDFVRHINDSYLPRMFQKRLEEMGRSLIAYHEDHGVLPDDAFDLVRQASLLTDGQGKAFDLQFPDKHSFQMKYEPKLQSMLFRPRAEPTLSISWQAGGPELLIESSLPHP